MSICRQAPVTTLVCLLLWRWSSLCADPTYSHTTPPAPVPPVPAVAFPMSGAPTGSADPVPSTIYTLPKPAEPHNTNSNRVMTSPIRSGTASAQFRSAAANNASAPTFHPMNNGSAPTFTPLLQAPGPAAACALYPLPSTSCPLLWHALLCQIALFVVLMSGPSCLCTRLLTRDVIDGLPGQASIFQGAKAGYA